jgi:parallel beta-helix repeat protein
MKTKQKGRIVVSILALAGLAAFSLMGYAGSLEPPTAPAPTMKTLDEVEPRVPIHASDLPLTITEPNSYYLVEGVTFASTATHAITIECNDVTIDLMGYTLKGPDSGTKSGIYMNRRTNVEIRNGTIRDFYYGIHEISTYGTQHRVMNVRVMSNPYYGIRVVGVGHLIKDCTAAENGNIGIYAWYGSTVTGNTAYANGGNGIYGGEGNTVTGNTAYYNGVNGIYAGSGSTVTGNTAYQNNLSDNSNYAGIQVNNGCLVKGNTVRLNNQNNIYVSGTDNAIEENLLTQSGNGICFADANNFYANNRASGHTEDYNDVDFPSQTDGGGNESF